MSDTRDLLFELGTEELPGAGLLGLARALEAEFAAGLNEAALSFGAITAYATPRRLALVAKDCAIKQPDRQTRRRGPAVAAAFDTDGRPTKAALGFARSCGVGVEQLGRAQTDKAEFLVFDRVERGQAAAAVLPGVAERALNRLPLSKRMRWGSGEARFARPARWLVFMLGRRVVPCSLLGVAAGNKSRGHRFHHPRPIALAGAAEYVDTLKAARVLVDIGARRATIQRQVEEAAAAVGGRADMDDGLLDEVTGLVEWPVPIAAGFEEKYLAAPAEVLALTMKKHQRYFPVRAAGGELLNRFITIANIDSDEPAVIRAGNERVARPRLADAMFFWRLDGKRRLAERMDETRELVFQKDLGSMHDKAERVAQAAGMIATAIGGDAAVARRAGLLSRCDLMTASVGEFAELQGVIGRHLARRDGEAAEACQALEELYLPRFAGDRLPQSRAGIAVAVADKLDTLLGVFGVGLAPSGDKDPFALRRAALGVLRILREHELALNLSDLLEQAAALLGERINAGAMNAAHGFMLERLRGMYSEQADTFNAVAARQARLGNIADFDRRCQAVEGFKRLPQCRALSAANKRIGNIIKKSSIGALPAIRAELLREKAEVALYEQVRAMKKQIAPLLARAEYAATLEALAALREPVDTFFDEVMVVAEDKALRDNRLALLSSVQNLFGQVADISLLRRTADAADE